MGRSSLLVGGLKPQYAQELLAERAPQHDNTTTTDSEMEEPYLQGEGGIPRGGTPARTLPRLGSAARCSLSAESKEEGAPPKLKCELCGRVDFAYKFKRSKRFCSMACAKRYRAALPPAPRPSPALLSPPPPPRRCPQVQRGLHQTRRAVPP